MSDYFSIAVVGQKGGTGKTTFARCIAYLAYTEGMKVKGWDLDKIQLTFADWQKRRFRAKLPEVAQIMESSNVYFEENEGSDFVVYDLPARTTKLTKEISKKADMVIQPTGPNIDDLRPAFKLFSMLIEEGIPWEKLILAPMFVSTDAEYDFIPYYMKEKKVDFRMLSDYISRKPAYARILNRGQSLLEIQIESLRDKADKVFREILKILYELCGVDD